MAVFSGVSRISPAMTSFAPFRLSMSSYRRSFFFPRIRSFRVSLHANSGGGDGKSAGGSEIIFIGTGTSEGIPRVSCLTNPYKKCTVCSKAVEPGNKNNRRNTSLLIRRATTDGTTDNILIDAGKFFYHSALQWFPAFGNCDDEVVGAYKLDPTNLQGCGDDEVTGA